MTTDDEIINSNCANSNKVIKYKSVNIFLTNIIVVSLLVITNFYFLFMISKSIVIFPDGTN